ncbi:fibronectin type III domain-containing protein [Plantactinospora sp. KLBMP9567]|uniref:fibronectin type III domain-containing protein n=1 Tax=Plantactinospora sp. KLBMP9567 TaxID=3085900 RepID=UPI0029824737|nr:fibronectin type III domain-containing protein [Plantactinospora sp. KLBMP9567]MDW5322238.1 fibronectin type III domain-containing protein [Plantactinospora sp. KLBMP9567]
MRHAAVVTAALLAFGSAAATAVPAGGTPATKAAGRLAAPIDLAVSGGGESGMLSWRQPPAGRARAFRVYEGGVEIARNTTTRAPLTNLGFARTRTYTVTAVDDQGRESAHSAPISRHLGISGMPPTCVPATLSDLAATAVSASAVTLSWTVDGDPGTTVVTGAPAGPLTTTQSGIRVGGLSPGTPYTFEVSHHPHCSGPAGPATRVAVVTVAGAASTPAPPADPAVTGSTDTTLTLGWQPPSTVATRYAVYESGRHVATSTGTSARVRGLYHAAGYAFQVTAFDARGNESPAVVVAGNTAACQTRPPRPAALTATVLSASSVRLSWEYDAWANGYTIYTGDVAVGTSAGTTTVLSGLPSATTQRLRVVATLPDTCGQSPASPAVAVTTPAGPANRPARPTDFRVASANPMTGAMTLTWTQPAGDEPAVGYRVYRGAEILAEATAAPVTLSLPQATTHVLAVVAVDGQGMESARSADLTVRVPYLPPP